jgi:hypothetical protein
MGLTEHLIRHGSVSPTWVSDVERDECLCRDAMAATARRIVDALRQRRNEYAAD